MQRNAVTKQRSTHSAGMSRRSLFRAGGGLAGCALAGSPTLTALSALAARPARAATLDFGPLLSAPDQATGFPLVQLPAGFSYISFNWMRDPLPDGSKTRGRHDGMGAVRMQGDIVHLVRNHEVSGIRKHPSEAPEAYDRFGMGGTTSLTFDAGRGKWLDAWTSLSGTSDNCCGGPTPWGTWLSCEETVAGPRDRKRSFDKQHGWVFEVPAEGVADPVPIRDAGVFKHEAVAVDPKTGYLYLTQDSHAASGFYRYIPNQPGRLAAGGRLYMASVPDRPKLTGHLPDAVPLQRPMQVEWVPIADPHRPHTQGNDGRGVFDQGHANGGSEFARLEGCWHESGRIVFSSTSGGGAEQGQVWLYEPESETLTLIYESPGMETLSGPDNLTVHPSGRFLIVCEDSVTPKQRAGGQRLQMLTLDGRITPFAVNTVRLDGSEPARKFKGNFSRSEWAGATFSADGRWLFVNIYRPGITLAITGPWP